MRKIHYTYHNQEKHFTSFIRRCTFHLGNKSYFLKLKLNQNKLKNCPNSIEKIWIFFMALVLYIDKT